MAYDAPHMGGRRGDGLSANPTVCSCCGCRLEGDLSTAPFGIPQSATAVAHLNGAFRNVITRVAKARVSLFIQSVILSREPCLISFAAATACDAKDVKSSDPTVTRLLLQDEISKSFHELAGVGLADNEPNVKHLRRGSVEAVGRVRVDQQHHHLISQQHNLPA
uniref:Uncharacterized protein n=1 Tax=Plectus sambesii TaxID=2011161 RepID=A0A914V9Y3_9BILA